MFLTCNARFPGSCHDSAIWTTSASRAKLINEYNAENDNWLIGDSGYPLEPWLLTPFSQPYGRQEVKYNKLHASARNTIERAFGVLKSRFRCLSKHRVLHYSPERAVNIINACVILHNILIKTRVVNDDVLLEEEIAEVEEVESQYLTNFHREGERVRRRYVNTL